MAQWIAHDRPSGQIRGQRFNPVDEAAEPTARNMESLKDQVAVVTGASSGIGKAIALALAGQGAELYLAARRKEALEGAAKEAQALGSRAHSCSLDLTSDKNIYVLGERVQREAGRLNILVLCGGALAYDPHEKAPLTDWI